MQVSLDAEILPLCESFRLSINVWKWEFSKFLKFGEAFGVKWGMESRCIEFGNPLPYFIDEGLGLVELSGTLKIMFLVANPNPQLF